MIFDDQVLTKARKLFEDGSNHSDEHHFSDLLERRKVTSYTEQCAETAASCGTNKEKW